MLIAFVALAGNASLIKKVGGYSNTKIHGYLMGAATALGCFGYYVIHSNKDLMNKAHLTTLHGKLGAACMVGYIGLGLFGSVALDPQWGLLKTNSFLRTVHKMSGRVVTWLAWTTSVLGFTTMYGTGTDSYIFGVPLLVFGYFCLL